MARDIGREVVEGPTEGEATVSASETAAACVDGFGAAAGRNSIPRVIPPNARPYGKSYGELRAVYESLATNLDAGDTNTVQDVFETRSTRFQRWKVLRRRQRNRRRRPEHDLQLSVRRRAPALETTFCAALLRRPPQVSAL